MSRISAIFFLVVTLSFLSCDDKQETVPSTKATVKINFDTRWQGSDFAMQEVYYDNFGHRIRIDKFMSYLSKLSLIKQDGSLVPLKDFYLANFQSDPSFTFEVEPGEYKGLTFGLGIPAAYNKNQDPAQYPSSSPLSVAGSQGMFWYWDTGYIFVKFEGKADLDGIEGAPLLGNILFHIGDDPLFRKITFDERNYNFSAGSTTQLNVKIAVDQLLGNGGPGDIDIADENITHSNNSLELAQRFINNFQSAITMD